MRHLICALALFAVPATASADCCRIVKVDAEIPSTQVRVCEPDATGGCGSVLLLRSFGVGESETVCSQTDAIVYSEFDAAIGAFGPFVGAVCAGGDVEL